jgi:hypothetical protein
MTTRHPRPGPTHWILGVLLLALAGGAWGLLRLRSKVEEALAPQRIDSRPLAFTGVSPVGPASEEWGGSSILAVLQTSTGFLSAGGAGVQENGRRLGGLPTLSATALAPWRGSVMLGLASGGLYRRAGEGWEEARSGWGVLHVRTLAETPAGELLVGAREGLYRAAWGAASLERLDTHPVRSIAVGSGFLLSAGEDGLYRVQPGGTLRLETPDPWVESVHLTGDEAWAVTAVGLARGPAGGPLSAVEWGGDVVAGCLHDGSFYGVDGLAAAVSRRGVSGGHRAEELLPAVPRRLFSDNGTLFADTNQGLCRREKGRWSLVGGGPPALPLSGHVSALATLNGRLVAGLFDGGLAVEEALPGGAVAFRGVQGSSTWGVNALLPSGGVLYVASLRGAARFDGRELTPLEGPGAAFSLAATPEGIAIGYGQGVLLPGPRLLSAFHGLPGNQALALAFGPDLYVGTPSGLGAVRGRKVRWRVGAGEGRLPHPWVTSLALSDGALFVGTYGGGIVRCAAGGAQDPGAFDGFAETEGLRVGSLLVAGGRVWAGTDGQGLYRSSADGKRFVPVPLVLPSPRVTALAATEDSLYVGTDEGLARIRLSTANATKEPTP